MIVEGLVSICQDSKKLQCKNHLTSFVAMFLFRMLMGSYVRNYGHSPNNTFIYLMRNFQIRLGNGSIQTPTHDLTALEAQVAILSGNTNLIKGDYNVDAPFDMVYIAQIDAYTLCSGASGVTINNIIQDVIAINVNQPVLQPVYNDKYIVGSGAVGAFAGHDHEIATWLNSEWVFEVPTASTAAYITDLNATYRFNGNSWIEIQPIRECGLFTYGLTEKSEYRWFLSYSATSAKFGESFKLAAYISANGSNPDFNVGDINLSKALTIEWTIRVAFAGDT